MAGLVVALAAMLGSVWSRRGSSSVRGRTAILAAIAVAVLGCATGTPMSHSDDMDAKRFAVPAGKARIYVTRPGQLKAAGLVAVTVDGIEQAELPIKSYVVVDVVPGHHKVAFPLKGEAMPIEAKEGAVYFFRISNGMTLKQDSEVDGRQAVMWSSRVVNMAQ